MIVTDEVIPGAGVALVVTDGDAVVAQATVLRDGDGWRVHRFWIDPDRRGDDAFAGELYPALIAKALELGWATEDDILAAEVTPRGVKVGRVLINTETDGQRAASLAFRTVGGQVVEDIAAKPEHNGKPVKLHETGYSADIEAVKAVGKLPKGEREAVKVLRGGAPTVVVDPDPPPSPSRPLRAPVVADRPAPAEPTAEQKAKHAEWVAEVARLSGPG